MKRLGRILKWVAIAAGAAIAVLLMINTYYVWSTGTQLERRLRTLRGAGDPVLLTDLARSPIPPETNADVYFRRAVADLDAMEKELLAWYPKTGYPTEPLSPTDRERLASLFNAYPRVIPLLEQAADCPDNDRQIDYTLPTSRFPGLFFESLSKHRSPYRVLRPRLMLLLSQGRYDDAMASQVLVLRLARRWLREPLIINYLTTTVCEFVAMDGVNKVLQAGPVSPAARQALDAELALHDNLEGVSWALRSERSFTLSAVREFPFSCFWLSRGVANDLMLRLLELYDRVLEDTSRPYAEVASRKHATARRRGGLNLQGGLVTLLEPGLVTCREPAERTRALSRSLRVLNALQVRVPPGSDRIPNLNDLGLPTEATIDPFSGAPLIVKKRPEGWMVYSVGKNLVDDGGKLDGNTDIGVGPISRGESPGKP
jgi:hypothetical protein